MSAFAIVLASTACAGNSGENKKSNEPTKEENKMEAVSLNKADFLKKVYNYEANPKEWKFEGSRPAIVDFYATWCGPCCAEIPHMEKLAAHYAKNKKIVLLSISLDKNKAKWEKKLAEDKPQWRQFICLDAFDSEVCKNYGINAIPRFLFFDKDGKVISLDAPRPSSAKITESIDRHIR